MGHRARREVTEITEEIGCTAANRYGETVTIDATYVDGQITPLVKNADPSKFLFDYLSMKRGSMGWRSRHRIAPINALV
tara:strand:+ start:360 stop:596 length:237 start_codon:yes stop_codon:yes gene_type:complete